MVDFVLTHLEGYYERKLLDAAHNRSIVKAKRNTKWLEPSSDILIQIKVPLNWNLNQDRENNSLEVPRESGSGSYVIDASLRQCDWLVGSNRALCKHQVWLAIELDLPPDGSRTVEGQKRMQENSQLTSGCFLFTKEVAGTSNSSSSAPVMNVVDSEGMDLDSVPQEQISNTECNSIKEEID